MVAEVVNGDIRQNARNAGNRSRFLETSRTYGTYFAVMVNRADAERVVNQAAGLVAGSTGKPAPMARPGILCLG
jgi:hypothetical protein